MLRTTHDCYHYCEIFESCPPSLKRIKQIVINSRESARQVRCHELHLRLARWNALDELHGWLALPVDRWVLVRWKEAGVKRAFCPTYWLCRLYWPMSRKQPCHWHEMKEKKIADGNGWRLREGTTPYFPASKTVDFGEEIGLDAKFIGSNISMNQFIEMRKCSQPITCRGRMIPRCTLSILGKVVRQGCPCRTWSPSSFAVCSNWSLHPIPTLSITPHTLRKPNDAFHRSVNVS